MVPNFRPRIRTDSLSFFTAKFNLFTVFVLGILTMVWWYTVCFILCFFYIVLYTAPTFASAREPRFIIGLEEIRQDGRAGLTTRDGEVDTSIMGSWENHIII